MSIFDRKKRDKEALDTSEYQFMSEVIKERPVNYKKILQKTIVTVSMALVFGLVASFVFIGLEPLASKWMSKEKEIPGVEAELNVNSPAPVDPEDEMQPDDMIQKEIGLPVTDENIDDPPLEGEAQNSIVYVHEVSEFGITEYKNLYKELSELAESVSKGLVEVTGVKQDVNWFQTTYDSQASSTGIVLNKVEISEEAGTDYLILVDYKTIEDADSVKVTFSDGETADATVRGVDKQTGFAVIVVSSLAMKESTMAKTEAVELSLDSGKLGDPVLAVGTILSSGSSMSFGMLTNPGTTVFCPDVNLNLLTTDIVSSKNPSGVLLNMDGKVIGILKNDYNDEDLGNLLSAVGISEVRNRLTQMMNGYAIPYVGLYVTDVPRDIRKELNIPAGAYVSQVDVDSPAMKAGIQVGDIITAIDDNLLYSSAGYTSTISSTKIGTYCFFTASRSTVNGYRSMQFAVLIKKN